MGWIYRRRKKRPDGNVVELRVWWLAYRQGGRVFRESSGSTKESVARRKLRLREGDVERGVPVVPKMGRVTFDEAARDLLTDYQVTGKRSIKVTRRRLEKHLAPYFGTMPMLAITPDKVRAYIAKRQADTVLVRRKPEVRRPVSNAEINRELTTLKRAFSIAIRDGKLWHKPHIPLLAENNVRRGFFDRAQVDAVCGHLPDVLADVVRFAFFTGWRIASEVLPLEWSRVDFTAGEIRLDAGTTKNGAGRVFPMTHELRELLKARHTEYETLKRAGHICPYVFVRVVAKGRGGPKSPRRITSFGKAWKAACVAAGLPGRIPHDLRRSAVRTFVRESIPERVAMTLTGHKTRSVFARYDIVSDGDLRDAARKLDAARERDTPGHTTNDSRHTLQHTAG
jgi:integrase